MTEFAMYSNAITYAQIDGGFLWARPGSSRSVLLPTMVVGDAIIPLFDDVPYHDATAYEELAAAAGAAELDPAGLLDAYRSAVSGGGVPFVLRVTRAAQIEPHAGEDVLAVGVETQPLDAPLSTADFLRLRALEDSIAAQLKGSTPLNPIVESPAGLGAAVVAATKPDRDEDQLLRRFSVVDADIPSTAETRLAASGRPPLPGDRVFLATRAIMPGVVAVGPAEKLSDPANPIAHSPGDALTILREARSRATAKDNFQPDPAIAAVETVIGLLQSGELVRTIDDYRDFYEYTVLARQITQALGLRTRAVSPDATDASPEVATEYAELATNLAGLTIEAVLEQLPNSFSVPRSVLAAAVTALRAGKHLLLGGPPGTGKTTLAEALCRAVVGTNYHVTTATADWTTFDTIGGYLPDEGGLKFAPGVVLRSLRTAGWLVIDEVNRADIDKAFGPLFTVLSGGDVAADRLSVLPYTTDDGPVTIKWAAQADQSSSVYSITPTWRLIGTLNLSDKASLYRLSFAFLRRFAVIDVPLPDLDVYRDLFTTWLKGSGIDNLEPLVDAAMAIASGPVPIGPAIGRDLAEFVIQGLAQSSSGSTAIADPVEALMIATRLFVVPQYEGELQERGEQLTRRISDALPHIDPKQLEELQLALNQVAVR